MAQNTGAIGRQVNAYDLASLYLRTAGLPNTPLNRRILAAWFMAESRRVGKTDIIVYNNNPLNIRPETNVQPYHTFKDAPGKFASYEGTTAGAQAWADFLKRNHYNGIITGFKNQDVMGVRAALAGKPHWGTGANFFYSIFKGLPADGATGTNLGDGTTFNGINNAGPIDATLASANGSTGYSTYESVLAAELEKYRIAKKISPDSPVTLAQLTDFYTNWLPQNDPGFLTKYPGIANNIQTYINFTKANGDGWSTWKELTQNPAVLNPDQTINTNDPLATIASFFDPTKWPSRMFRIGGIVIGAIMVAYGTKIIIQNAGVDGVSAGAGGATTIIKQRYPAIVDSSEVDDEVEDYEPESTTEAVKNVTRAVGTKARHPRRTQEDIEREQALSRLSREAQESNKDAASSRSNTQAPLKSETGAA